jgi:hypothetical protein
MKVTRAKRAIVAAACAGMGVAFAATDVEADNWKPAPYAACATAQPMNCQPGSRKICMCSDRFEAVCACYCVER